MLTSMRLTPVRTICLAVLGVLSLFYVLVFSQLMLVPLVLGVLLVAAALWTANHLANVVADRLGSEHLPWLMYAAVTSTGVIGIVSLLEIGAMFEANDGVTIGSGIPTGALVTTGFAGVGSALAVVVLGLIIWRQLARSVPARRA